MHERKNSKKRSGKRLKKPALKLQQKANKQVKYRFICLAKNHLTKYNFEKNKEVEERCIQDPKFEPKIDCFNHELDIPYTASDLDGNKESGTLPTHGQICKYLEVRKIG